MTLIKAGPSDNIHRFLPENRRKILFVGYCRTCKVLGIFSKFNHTITKMIFEVFKLKFFFQSNYYKFSFKECSSSYFCLLSSKFCLKKIHRCNSIMHGCISYLRKKGFKTPKTSIFDILKMHLNTMDI